MPRGGRSDAGGKPPPYDARGGAGDARGGAGDARGDAGDARGGAGDARGGAGDARGGAGDARGGAGDARGGAGDARGGAGDARGGAGDARGGAGDARGGAGDARGGAGVARGAGHSAGLARVAGQNAGVAGRVARVAAVCAVALVLGCKRAPAPPPSKPAPRVEVKEPLFAGTGTWTRKIETTSADAQRYFDQGLRFLYGFNHDEAIRSFEQAAAFDPRCAMCFVFIAVSNGPHINNPDLDEPHRSAGLAAAERALTLIGRGSPGAGPRSVEHGLAASLAARFQPPTQDAPPLALTTAHAQALRALWKEHPDDVDLGALAAEAMMDVRPWDQWTPDGEPQPGTEDIAAVIGDVLKRSPLQPLANHLAIHLWEASSTPAHAAMSAERLRTMAPALAHLVHMPSHLDVRLGRFADAVKSSQAALAADAAYLARVPRQGFYLFYVAHNEHMLAYAAMMTGQKQLALQAIDRMVKDIPEDWLRENAAVADGIVALPLEVKMRFGLWDDILAAPDFGPALPIARAMRLGARAVAWAAKHDVARARQALAALDDAVAALPADARFGNNDGRALLAVARALAAGEVAVAAGKTNDGIAALREAVAAEDALRYDEPPDWLQPARHALGAVLMNMRRDKEAEAVYREDLRRVPENGWALLGLAQALEAQGRSGEAKPVRARFDAVWKDADIKPTSSCLCQPRR